MSSSRITCLVVSDIKTMSDLRAVTVMVSGNLKCPLLWHSQDVGVSAISQLKWLDGLGRTS